MKKEKYEEVFSKVEKDKWTTLPNIESIILDDGTGIYPNWKHLRFLLRENDILISHGDSEPYGARLGNKLSISSDQLALQFPPAEVIQPSQFYGNFRKPKVGDILRSTVGKTVLSNSLIKTAKLYGNAFYIELTNSVILKGNAHLSFYDAQQYIPSLCMHGDEEEGIYMRFTPNPSKKIYKELQYHQVLKIKSISEIKLKLQYKNEIYTVR